MHFPQSTLLMIIVISNWNFQSHNLVKLYIYEFRLHFHYFLHHKKRTVLSELTFLLCSSISLAFVIYSSLSWAFRSELVSNSTSACEIDVSKASGSTALALMIFVLICEHNRNIYHRQLARIGYNPVTVDHYKTDFLHTNLQKSHHFVHDYHDSKQSYSEPFNFIYFLH